MTHLIACALCVRWRRHEMSAGSYVPTLLTTVIIFITIMIATTKLTMTNTSD